MKTKSIISKFSFLSISALLLLCNTVLSQPLNSKLYKTSELKTDLDFLVSKLEEYHPKLYQYTSKESFNHLLDEAYSKIRTVQTSEEFFLTIEPVVNSVKCSHTRIRLPGKIQESYKQIRNQPLEFFLDASLGIGFIKVLSFGIKDMNRYMILLDSAFQSLQQSSTTTLVIDLRNNDGGHPIFAAQLFSYLTKKNFTWFERNKEVPDFEPLYNSMQADKNSFKGKLYVFVNGSCLSSTGHLISLLKDQTNAIFIGEEPGSTYSCNDMSIHVKLPNTGIEANIPRTTFVTAISEETKNTPFVVDYKISKSIDTDFQGPDSYLEMLIKILQSS